MRTNNILEFFSFNILGQVDDIRRHIKEYNESIKADVKNLTSGINDMTVVTKSMKEDVKDMKKDIKEFVNKGVKEALNEMKNAEQAEMEEGYVIISMENIEKYDFPIPSVSALGELYLVGFIFALNMKFSPWFDNVF